MYVCVYVYLFIYNLDRSSIRHFVETEEEIFRSIQFFTKQSHNLGIKYNRCEREIKMLVTGRFLITKLHRESI